MAQKDREEGSPAEWRRKAAQMRKLATATSDPEAKQMMDSIARAYEGLAQRAEERRRKR